MATAIPPGLDIYESQGPQALAADLVTLVIAEVFVGLRLWARRVGGSNYWWDDWCILIVALILVPGSTMETVWTAKFSLGRHIEWVMAYAPETLPPFVKMLYADEQLYAPCISLIKLSILCLYVRLFGVRRSFAIVCQVQMALVIIWAVVSECVFLFQCSPVSLGWSADRSTGTCFVYSHLFYGTNAVNSAMDVAILVTPLYPIWSLKTTLRKKLLISGVLALGAGELIFSILRLVKVGALLFEDVTWDTATALQWSVVELHVGIVCACLPVLAPLLPKSWTGRGSTTRGSSSWKKQSLSPYSVSSNQAPPEGSERKLVVPEDSIWRTTEVALHVVSPSDKTQGYHVGDDTHVARIV